MAGLKTYRGKRRFGVTAEPKGKFALKRGHTYVIQKHDATRLHYDLRLELDGVMKSWAVTRGPSLVPSDKRLAVEVEDHPVDYNTFEGTIPKGEYGGGTVMVWDRGTWQPDGDPHKGLKKGHLAFTLNGAKLHGAWHLVRLRKRSGEKRNNWLLIKSDDDQARTSRDKDILEEADLSIKTGRSMDEIAAGQNAREKTAMKKVLAVTKKKIAASKTRRATKSTGEAKAGKAQKETSKKKASAQLVQKHDKITAQKTPLLKGAKRAALPAFVEPCLATLADKAPDSANWIHEIKFDGYRLQARLDRGKVKLLTRNGHDWTRKFAGIADAAAALDADTALIDGELVVEGEDGVTSFSLLQEDLKSGRQDRLVYYVFDLLYLDGQTLRALPLIERKDALAELVRNTPESTPLRFSESIAERGPVLLRHACELGLEGIISKRGDAPYRSGRGHDWVKTKCTARQEFVIAGFTPSTADARAVGALVLGVHRKGKLVYAGRTGTGFTHQSARELYRQLKALERKTTPFAELPPGGELGPRPARARPGGRSRLSRLDAWRPCAPRFFSGPSRRQVSARNSARKAVSRNGRRRQGKDVRQTQRALVDVVEDKGGRDDRCGHSHPSRSGLLGGCRRHQARSRRLLQRRLEMDGAACRRPADFAAALPRRRERTMFLPETRGRRHLGRASGSRRGER